MSKSEHEVLVTQSIPESTASETRVCPIARIQETASLLSVDVASPTTSPVHLRESKYVDLPSRPRYLGTPRKSAKENLKSDVDDISVWSDTLSVTLMPNPPYGTEFEDRKSLIEARTLSEDRRYSSSIGSGNFPLSPRPGSRGSRRSRRNRSSQRSGEGKTRGDLLMDMSRQGSTKSRERKKSCSSNRDSVNEKNAKKNQRKNSDSSTSSAATVDEEGGAEGAGFPGKRGYMTAKEAVKLGDVICGCFLKDKLVYFLKPLIFLTFGSTIIAGGLALTILHFIYEDSLTQKNPPYFTYGPITFSTGVILFMVGLVWFPIKQQKWTDGTASPMIHALAKWRQEQADLELKTIVPSSSGPLVGESGSIKFMKENEIGKCDSIAEEEGNTAEEKV